MICKLTHKARAVRNRSTCHATPVRAKYAAKCLAGGLVVVGRVALSFAVATHAMAGLAEQPFPGRIKKFALPEYFNPPNENQVRSFIHGAEAQVESDGRLTIYQLEAVTFRQTGERELEISAPTCNYDPVGRQADSAGPLEVRTGEGRLRIVGRGFLWRRDEASLIISNEVHCTLKTVLAQACGAAALAAVGVLPIAAQTNLAVVPEAGTTEKSVTEIFAQRAEFDLKSNVVRYIGNVRVENPELKVRCETLAAQLPVSGGRFESIIAEGDVEFDTTDAQGRKISGAGQKAVYTYRSSENGTNETIELTGNPLVRTDQGTLAGDTIVFDRITGRITATNPRMTVGQTGPNGTNAAAHTNASGAVKTPPQSVHSDGAIGPTGATPAQFQPSLPVNAARP